MNLILQMEKMYNQHKRNVETRERLELGRVRQAIVDEESSKNPNPDYFHSLEKRKEVLERELHAGRYAIY
ncbi:MAG: hypothetical protein WC511_03890 [Candidatus Pacearchaeota archaeon]